MKCFGVISIAFAVLLAACTSSQPESPTTAGRCVAKDLEMQLIGKGVGLGNSSSVIEVRNKSERDCTLYGYADLQLLDKFRQPLPTKLIQSTTSYFIASPATEEVVTLPPGTEPMNSSHEVPGHAYFPLAYTNGQEPCSQAAFLKVKPPEASTALVISAVPAGSEPGYIAVCSGGMVIVNPSRPAVIR